MKFDELRQGFNALWDSAAEGWQRLRQNAAGALTSFRPGAETRAPTKHEVDDAFYLPSLGWSMLGGDVFEDDERVIVRLEIPGLEKEQFEIDAVDDALIVRGEKRFERESTSGRYRSVQCAYGSFRRVVPLPATVLADKAEATYRNGVLKVVLPKAAPRSPGVRNIKVS